MNKEDYHKQAEKFNEEMEKIYDQVKKAILDES